MTIRLLRYLASRPMRDLLFLGQVTGMVLTVRLALWLLPYRWVTRAVGLDASVQPAPPLSAEALRYRRRVVTYTAGVSRRLLGDRPCLVQALVAYRLLRRAGQPTVLQIGVASDEKGGVRAHAWLEDRGHIVIGAWRPEQQYTRLQPLSSTRTG
jgi:hypothetical protein